MLLTYSIVVFHMFYDGAVDIQICALLTRSWFKVSDNQVTLTACGPLGYIFKQEKQFLHQCLQFEAHFADHR